MRGGLTAIQQTLTPEAASVLTHSIAEAGRRNHGQTTPLHVAATLLSSPAGFLRQACIRSHPNSSHPLQCRALELCFSVALERLPTAAGQNSGEPPISNALMAALKRAQAHQRRGCPENQQQPLLAVKVELEQLIISILDDPSVSRVMREASFSSPAVKAAIEHGLSCRASPGPGSKFGMTFRPGPGPGPVGGGGGGGRERNLYLNPRLQQQQGSVGLQGGRGEDVKRVMDILFRPKKRNPVLVGESEPQEVVRQVLKNVEIHDGLFQNVEVVSIKEDIGLDYRSQMPAKLKELGGLIERKMVVNSRGGNGVILDLGDLKWLVDQPSNQGALEAARGVVSEMGRILRKFGEGSKVWLIGTATCETYLRCQVYHPTMENEWDLQVVSIVARSSIHGMLPRLGSNGGILSNSIECLSPMKNFPMGGPPLTRRVSENLDPSRRVSCCPQCTEKCNQEVAELTAEQAAKSLQSEAISDVARESLPPWLQNAKLQANDDIQAKNQDLILRQKTQELLKKWGEKCLQLHPNFHQNVSSERSIQSPLSMKGLYNPNLLGRQPFQPKLQQPRTLSDALQLNISPAERPNPDSPPGSPVRTDLILGPTKHAQSAQDKALKERARDFLGCISSESQNKSQEGDVDSFKRLLKGLMETVWWQREAASSLASAITQCKLGNGKRRGGGSRGDVWLLFSGPDRTGKRKMACALSELLYGVKPMVISLGTRRYGDESSDFNFRGKTAIDRIAEGVRRNPFSVIVLQDIDEADMVVQSNIRQAMEKGRLADSHGRENGLGSVIFVITSSWVPHQQLEGLSGGGLSSEERMTSLASGGWQLRISIMGEKFTTKNKRAPPNWLLDHNDDDGDNYVRDRSTKQRKEISPDTMFDLNRIADNEADRLDGSNNSSDLTVDHEDEHVQENRGSPTSSTPYDLFDSVDVAIIFKPVEFTPTRQNIERTITTKFSNVLGEAVSLKIENEALEKILSGIWLGQTALETWVDKVLGSSILQLKMNFPSLASRLPEGKVIARLELDKESESRAQGDWLPGKISVVADAQ